jgi:hypothetical protein
MAEDERKTSASTSASTRADFIVGDMDFQMARSPLSVDHRLWLDLLCIYMPVVTGDSFFNPHDVRQDYDRLVSGHCRGILFFLAQPLPQ